MAIENFTGIERNAIIEMIPGIGDRFALLGKVVSLGVELEIARPPLPNFQVDLEDLLKKAEVNGLKFRMVDGAGEAFSLDEIRQYNRAVINDQQQWEVNQASGI